EPGRGDRARPGPPVGAAGPDAGRVARACRSSRRPGVGARARRPGWTRGGAAAAEGDRVERPHAARRVVGGTTKMSTSRYFRGVKLEDPSVTACRNELLTRWWTQREAEAARVAPAAVVAAKG